MKIRFKRILVKLLRLNNTPAEIAMGVAIGVFIVTLPLYGLHTLLVLVAAVFLRRVNKIAILVGANFSIPPTLPFITWISYEIGRLIFGKRLAPFNISLFKNITWQKIAIFYPPLFVGSVIFGLFCAAIFYFLTLFIVRRFHERRKLRKQGFKTTDG